MVVTVRRVIRVAVDGMIPVNLESRRCILAVEDE
jgi:hypothetical protein